MKNSFKNMKKAEDKLVQSLIVDISKKRNSERDILEEYELSFEGTKYALVDLGDNDWENDGKYQNRYYSYQLVSFDDSKTSYPCDSNILDEYDISIDMCGSRTGSYYSEYYYDYDEPEFYRIKKVVVPEVVIPKHEDVKFEKLILQFLLFR